MAWDHSYKLSQAIIINYNQRWTIAEGLEIFSIVRLNLIFALILPWNSLDPTLKININDNLLPNRYIILLLFVFKIVSLLSSSLIDHNISIDIVRIYRVNNTNIIKIYFINLE